MAAVKAEIADFPELVATVTGLMAPYGGTWALCGGWAIDSWLGRVTRTHEDLDIAVFLDEQRLCHSQLADWRLVAHETDDADHQIIWDGHALAPAAHVHAGADLMPRRELHMNERNLGEGTWTLRRQNRSAATLPLPRFALQSPLGLPTLAPEGLLYYKLSGEKRARDKEDIELLMPGLDAQWRAWLASALGSTVAGYTPSTVKPTA